MSSVEVLSAEEREEDLLNVARLLEGTAREALIEGNKQFADLSQNMAEAILVNADELAREDHVTADILMQQATTILSQFNASHPYRVVSYTIN